MTERRQHFAQAQAWAYISLRGAPSSFQRLMDSVLRGLFFVTNYVDDILVHSPDDETHSSHLQEVFNRLRAAGRGENVMLDFHQLSILVMSSPNLKQHLISAPILISLLQSQFSGVQSSNWCKCSRHWCRIGTRRPCHCLCESFVNPTKVAVQCYTERVLVYCLW